MAIQKPELLLPAGNAESFFAALRGGADAVFLGLRQFNARGRAMNFSNAQLMAAIREAKAKNVKVYVTLNTVVKNSEIKELIDVLAFLDKVKVDAVIIQDWGVYRIARKFFPALKLHASTQMGNHNSAGVNYNAAHGIARTILARELTMPELEKISGRINSEIELFVHGALCYSFSGMCLFSSYQGGQGANRGMCAQPCRMKYNQGSDPQFLFSLKDNRQIENLRKLAQNGVCSLKVEGRMKSADYVFRVSSAYRKAIDQVMQPEQAMALLNDELGREKTSYFLGRNVKNVYTADSNTGLEIGMVETVGHDTIGIRSTFSVGQGSRLRFLNATGTGSVTLKVNELIQKSGLFELLHIEKKGIGIGDRVFLVGLGEEKFPTKFRQLPAEPEFQWSRNRKQLVYDSFIIRKNNGAAQLFVRIDHPDWLRKIRLNDVETLILKFRKTDWAKTDWQSAFMQENRAKIAVELPRFIAEDQLAFYRKLAANLFEWGFRRFFVSHLSQKLILPAGAQVSATENVYVFNDAAASLMADEKLQDFCYPYENDLENLLQMRNRNGLVPLYFYPELFFSRMPVNLPSGQLRLRDENNKAFRRIVRNGMTVVIPEMPVSLTQYKKQLQEAGFHKFLVDFSYDIPTGNVIKKVITRVQSGEQIHPSTTFNFKKGLK